METARTSSHLLLGIVALLREVRGGASRAFGLDHAVGDQLPHKKRKVLRGGAEMRVDLLESKTGILRHVGDELIAQSIDVRWRPLAAPACLAATYTRMRAAAEAAFEEIHCGAARQVGDLSDESTDHAIHLRLKVDH